MNIGPTNVSFEFKPGNRFPGGKSTSKTKQNQISFHISRWNFRSVSR